MFTKPMLSVMVLILAVSSIYSVYAQSDIVNTIHNAKILELDNMLIPSITAVLTSLSLTGGAFLVNVARTSNDSDAEHISIAIKSFIKAFFMFLICTVFLFIFDFLEILDENNIEFYTIFDVVISYVFFGIGIIYLIKAAQQLYIIYGK